MSSLRPKVIIVGGGFGGLTCAQSLARAEVDVTVLDRTNHHLFQPLLYQVAMCGLSPAEIASPIRGVIGSQKNATVLLGEVVNVDVAGKKVHVRYGHADDTTPGEETQLDFDYLVLAGGVKTAYFGHEEWKHYAPGLKSLSDAIEIRRRVLTAFEEAEHAEDDAKTRELLTFVVIGAGPTGVELSGAIAELARHVLDNDFKNINPDATRVVLVEGGPRVLSSFHESLSASAAKQLGELGVELALGKRVSSIDEQGVNLDGGERIQTRTVLWAAGVRGTRLAETVGAPLDKMGRVIVGTDCSIPEHENVFVIGDMAHFVQDDVPLPGLSPVAMQQGRYVARVITKKIPKESREVFHYVDKGTMATIGRSRAIAESYGIRMKGLVAWLAWLFVHLMFLVGFRSRVVVLFTWAWSYVFYKRGARLITERPFDVDRPAAGAP